jgi:hypothetical protein
VILEWFSMYEVASEYAKSILACTENTLKEFKNLRIIRKEYFAVHGDHADRQKVNQFSPKTKKKFRSYITFQEMTKSAKKTFHTTVPLRIKQK